MNQQAPRYGVDPYLDWVKQEGLPVTEDYGVDLFAVPTVDWPRYGVKGGAVYGATDEIGYRAVDNRVSVQDFHATVLHLLGLNHRNLVFEREGRSERLTDEFPARVVQEILG